MQLFLSPHEYIETTAGMDISLPLSNTDENPRAWYVDAPRFEPVRANGFIGSIAEGGSVNFRDVFFNPHGHGTHTECVGHIAETVFTVDKTLQDTFFETVLISIKPEEIWNEAAQTTDRIITVNQLQNAIAGRIATALVIRTLPNDDRKKITNYSATNPTYLELACVEVLNEAQVVHLLVDLPSVDREEDGGELAVHHAFWQYPDNPQHHKTITELVFVPSEIKDGNYLMNLQTAHFVNDATPSRPILFAIKQV